MKEQEALFQLGQFDFEYVMTEAQKEAYRMAIKALEMQIPKKPTFTDFNFDGIKSTCAYCPNCDCSFGEIAPSVCANIHTMKLLFRYDRKMCSCERCGQRIDWGNEA